MLYNNFHLLYYKKRPNIELQSYKKKLNATNKNDKIRQFDFYFIVTDSKIHLMDAFILAAGLGTRLSPLTNKRPKALVEVDSISLLEINIRKLTKIGFKHIVVNIHHFADMMRSCINSHNWDCDISISDESDLLLDTGGALRKAEHLFKSDTVLVHNVDILTDIDINAMTAYHYSSGNMATLAASHRITSRYLLTDTENRLVGWKNTASDEIRWVDKPQSDVTDFAFSGISLISKNLIHKLPTPDHPYPIIPEYLRLAINNPIGIFEHCASNWLDVGKKETLANASAFMKEHPSAR